MSIPIYDPSPEINYLRKQIDEAIGKVVDHGQFILGPEVEQFEQEAAQYLGVDHAVGVNSGTDALVIALRALGIGEGDEVITTALSFFATAESISRVGATPIFADIDERTFNIDARKIEAAITPQTKALLPVHLFGRPASIDKITKIAEQYDLKVIEDCAQSFGAAYEGRKTGSIGDAGTFSFFPTKNLGGIGDGGLIATDNDGVARKARMLRVHGANRKYHNEMLGYNSRLDTMQAAVLSVKLNYVDEFNTGRQAAAQRYNQELGNISALILPAELEGHVFHQYTLRIKKGKRDALKSYLASKGIGTKIYFPVPLNELPVYNEPRALPVAHRISDQVLSLPMGPRIPCQIQEQVSEAIAIFFEKM